MGICRIFSTEFERSPAWLIMGSGGNRPAVENCVFYSWSPRILWQLLYYKMTNTSKNGVLIAVCLNTLRFFVKLWMNKMSHQPLIVTTPAYCSVLWLDVLDKWYPCTLNDKLVIQNMAEYYCILTLSRFSNYIF